MSDSSRSRSSFESNEQKEAKRYPLLTGAVSHFPQDGVCPACGQQKVLEPNSFVALTGGAILMDREEDYGGSSDLMDGFLDVVWHDSHGSGPEEPDTGFVLPIAQKVKGGQFGIFCCSVACLRKLLNHVLDRVEVRIRAES